eukprot:g974.t1
MEKLTEDRWLASTANAASLADETGTSFRAAATALKNGLRMQRKAYLSHLSEQKKARKRAEDAVKRLKANMKGLCAALETSQVKNAKLQKRIDKIESEEADDTSMFAKLSRMARGDASFAFGEQEKKNPFGSTAKENATDAFLVSRKHTSSKITYTGAARELSSLYKESIQPLEELYLYNQYAATKMRSGDFCGKPIVLLLGPYSSGKTTFIQYLLGQDFPFMHVGPEPTTDTFTVIAEGPVERELPGAVLSSMTDRQFTNATRFGNSFLAKFRGVDVPKARILKKFTLIDTPGVLAGAKQRNRSYNFERVVEWLARISDRILVLFDAHKLDVSNELCTTLRAIRPFDNKIRFVLNKADSLPSGSLFRVYGSMMWALGKAMERPEALQVFVASLHSKPLVCEDAQKPFIVAQMQQLLADLHDDLPRDAALRRLGDLARRAAEVRTHVLLVGYLKEQMPLVFGKEKARSELIRNLATVFKNVSSQYDIAPSDMPELSTFRSWVSSHADWRADFRKPRPALLEKMTSDIDKVLPALMRKLGATSGC